MMGAPGTVRTLMNAWLGAVLLLAAAPARADGLVTSLSQNVVRISTDYAGAQIILFGAVERYNLPVLGQNTPPNRPPQPRRADIAVVVKGPRQDATIRRKGRVSGIWVNVASAEFKNVPSYYLVAATAKLDAIAATDALNDQGIGLDHLALAPVAATPGEGERLRKALMQMKIDNGLYTDLTRDRPGGDEAGEGIRLVGNTLFSLKIPLPPDAPVGSYEVRVYLMQDGAIVPSTPIVQTFYLRKSGFERWAYKHAMTNPLLYGLAAILLMVVAGFGASALFRKA